MAEGIVLIVDRRRRIAIDLRATDLTTHVLFLATTQLRILWILKAGELTTEGQQHIARRTLTVFSNDDLCHTTQVASVLVLIDVIILRTMNKQHHIRILFNGSRLTQVRELWAFSFQTLA